MSTDVDFINDDNHELMQIRSRPDPQHMETNEKDPYKYYIDAETGYRIVSFVEGDKENPLNWSKAYKWYITFALGLVCLVVAFGSAVVTGDMAGPMEYFGVSEEVMILTVTLFVLGFGIGPLLFAPMSEEFGRQMVYVTTLFVAVVFIVPCALAPNIGCLLAFRLLDGIAFSAPMTVIGGSLADIWVNKERGVAMSVFSAAPFLGPVLGPLVGGFIGDNAYWRWIYYVTLIFAGVVYAVMVLTVPETHHSTILARRAKKLIKETGDDRYRTEKQLKKEPLSAIMVRTLKRPPLLLTELIVFLVTIYMSVLYGLLYMFFFAYPVVYAEGKGWSDSMTGLMFIPIMIGVLTATAFSPFINNDYIRRATPYVERGELPPAELRLIPMMAGCWLVPIGLFIYAWTSYPTIHWIGPCISGFPIGIGFIVIYNSANNYIVDSYQHLAASALAAKTCIRSYWGAVVPLFTIQMYHRLGYEWATSLLGFIALACCAIPYLFFFYGARIRAKSKYAYHPHADKADSSNNSANDSSDKV